MSFKRVRAAPWLALDYTNDTEAHRDIDYASVTAPAPCFVTVRFHEKGDKIGRVVDGVYVAAGGSHSWWAGAHGKLLKRGLNPGERVTVEGTAEFAFRWDWTDE